MFSAGVSLRQRFQELCINDASYVWRTCNKNMLILPSHPGCWPCHYKDDGWTIFRFRTPHINRKNLPRLHPDTRNLPTKKPRCLFSKMSQVYQIQNNWKPTHPLDSTIVRPLSHRWGIATNQTGLGRLQWKKWDGKIGFNIWVVVSNMFYFHPYLGKIPILTNMFQRGGNHQLEHLLFV